MNYVTRCGLLMLLATSSVGCVSPAARWGNWFNRSSKPENGQLTGGPKDSNWMPWTQNVSDESLLGSDDIADVAPAPAKKLTPEQSKENRFVEQIAAGRALEQTNQWDKAAKTYEPLVKDYPQKPEAWHRLAVVNDRRKRHTEAQKQYAEAIRLDPRNAEYFNDLGYSFFLSGKMNKAESAMLKAVALAPDVSRYHNNLGMVYGHDGRTDAALAEFREAGSEADAYFNLAFIFASQERVDEAKVCFRKAVAADPRHEKAREALASFEQYERTPVELREMEEEMIADGSRKWVPYVEGASDESADVMQASAESSSANGTDSQVKQAGGNTLPTARGAVRAGREMFSQAQTLRDRHYSSKRTE